MAPLLIGPRCNGRVTCDSNPDNDRSESAIAADLNNPYRLIVSSTKFTDPQTSGPQERIFQRNARHVITGSVALELQVEDEK